MRFTIPAGHIERVASHGYVQVYKRQLNQTALYLLTFKGTTIHVGKRRHISRKFNNYRGAPGLLMEKSINSSWYSDATS